MEHYSHSVQISSVKRLQEKHIIIINIKANSSKWDLTEAPEQPEQLYHLHFLCVCCWQTPVLSLCANTAAFYPLIQSVNNGAHTHTHVLLKVENMQLLSRRQVVPEHVKRASLWSKDIFITVIILDDLIQFYFLSSCQKGFAHYFNHMFYKNTL